MTPTRYWTCYWRHVNWKTNAEYEPVGFSGGGSFRKRGVSAGDVVYIISQGSGQLLLGGRMTVGRIVSRDEAKRIRKRDDLLSVDEWLVGEEGSGTPLNLHRQLTPELTKQLQFVSKGANSKALRFVTDNNLDGQTTRPVRELTIESAFLLDEIIDATDRLPRSSSTSTVTDEHLRQYRMHRDAGGLALPEIRSGVTYIEGSVQRILVNR